MPPPAPDGLSPHPLSWRSRPFRLTASLLLLILLLRLIWGWQTHRALSAQLADLRRQGQPTTAADLTYAPLPNSQNAWHYQTLAILALAPGVLSPGNSNLEFHEFPPYPPEWWKLADASERANATAFSLARQAAQYPRAQFRTHFSSPLSTLSYLSSVRTLANTLADGALRAHLTGNDPEALDRVRDTLHLADSLRQDDFLISQLVATGIDALACDRLQIIAPGLRLQPDAPTAPTAPATRDRTLRLIRQLLDEDLLWQGYTRSLQTERLYALDAHQSNSQSVWFIRPLADRQGLRDIRNFQIAIQASRLRNDPETQAALSQLDTDPYDYSLISSSFRGGPPPVPRYSRWFNTGGAAFASRYATTTFRALADRRATAVSLAAQLYRADHHGSWPARLQDLVPTYLPSLPPDPFHDDNRPLGYVFVTLPDHAPRPLLFFDAGDATDALISPKPMYGWQNATRSNRYNSDIRQYRDLSRFTPPPPSTKAVDDNP